MSLIKSKGVLMPFVVIENKPDTHIDNPNEVYTSKEAATKVWRSRTVMSGLHYLVEFEGPKPVKEGSSLQGKFKVLDHKDLFKYLNRRMILALQCQISFGHQDPWKKFLKEGFKFLGDHSKRNPTLEKETELFLKKIYNKIGADFFKLEPTLKVEKILQNRLNNNFFKIFLSNWKLSEILLNKIFLDFPQQKQEMLTTRFGTIYWLNRKRRLVIPDPNARLNTPIEEQQRKTLDIMERALQNRHHTPDLNIAAITVRFKAIDAAESDGLDLKIPPELKCPLSMNLFVDPVKVERILDGKIFTDYFERSFITRALKTKEEHPLTRQKLSLADLKEAPEMKEKIETFKQELFTGPLAEKIQGYIDRMLPEENNSANLNPVIKKH